MEREQTSFIPKRSLTLPDRPAARPMNLLMVIAVAILILAALFYGGARFYQNYLEQEISQKCDETVSGDTSEKKCGLEAAVLDKENNLDRATILDLERLDKKLRIVGDLKDSHATAIPIFKLLEELTLPTVHYNSFSYTPKAISIQGGAGSYEDIAVQTQVFSDDKGRIDSFLFSDLDLDSKGEVVFKLTIVPNPNLISYLNNLSLNNLTP